MGDPTVFLATYSVKLANYDYDKLGEVYDILGEFATYWERFATYWEITTYREGCDILGLYKCVVSGVETTVLVLYQELMLRSGRNCKFQRMIFLLDIP